MSIGCLHWGHVGPRVWQRAPGTLYALWPAPVDHDVCFQEAGFSAFADTDDAWHDGFSALSARTLTALSALGPLAVHGSIPVAASWWQRTFRPPPPPGPAARLVLSAHDDQFGECTLTFGTPPRGLVMTSDGHPILWIWLAAVVADTWIGTRTAAAGALSLIETTSRWDALLPTTLA